MPKNSLQRLCASGWAGINARSRCAQGSAYLLPPPLLSSPPHLTSPSLTCFIQSRAVCKRPHRLRRFSATLYSWLESCAWECSSAGAFSGKQRVTLMSCRCWHVYIHSLSVCPLCCTVFDSLQLPVCVDETGLTFLSSSPSFPTALRCCTQCMKINGLQVWWRTYQFSACIEICQIPFRAGGGASFFFHATFQFICCIQ